MIAIDDPALPGLADLTADGLRRITGADDVSLMRLRYRAGHRAILHLATGNGAGGRQGSVWFFQGDKARRLAKRAAGACYDERTAALYQAFPNDHRLPQIRAFLDSSATKLRPLLGGFPEGQPELLRYRPGLSCTFRCAVTGGDTVFVKLIGDENPVRLALMNERMSSLLAGSPVLVAPVIGTDTGLFAISYSKAPGTPLDAALAQSGGIEPIQQALDALRLFWRLDFTPVRHLSRQSLLQRAAECVALVSVTVPACREAAERIRSRLDDQNPHLGCRPIHADIKLEHLFLAGGATTLIDTESVSLGPPDYDLAQLCGRLWQAQIEGQLPARLVELAARAVEDTAGPGFRWCLDVVALRLAKYYAQRPAPDAAAKIAAVLGRLA